MKNTVKRVPYGARYANTRYVNAFCTNARRTVMLRAALIALGIFFCGSTHLGADTISFSAGTMKGNTAEGREYTKLEENATIKTDSIEVTADTIELNGSEYRFIGAESNVHGKSFTAGFDFSCNKLSFDRTTNIIILEGNVKLTDTANGVDAQAQIIEYDQNTDVAVMQIGVKLLNKTSVCSGALAIYRKNDKTVELSGSPNIVRGSDNFRAQEIILNLETEEITLDGKVRGSVSDDGNNGGA